MYIPANRIKPNLYTRGNEYVKKSNRKNYIGFYYSLADAVLDGWNKYYVAHITSSNALDINGNRWIHYKNLVKETYNL